MNKSLHTSLAIIAAFLIQFSYAQVMQVSNNTNIQSGFILPNGRALLFDKPGFLWTTDGATASQISAIVTRSASLSGMLYKGQYYFAGRELASADVELWTTDGTAAGTRLVSNISAVASSSPENFFVLNNTLFFTADDGNSGRELWKSNGSIGNASLVADINGGKGDGIKKGAGIFQNGNTMFFPAVSNGKTGLWKTDASGTPSLVANIDGDIRLGTSIYSAAFGDKTIFTVAVNGSSGNGQLYITDGTTAGTALLKDFGFGSGSMVPYPVAFKNKIFFTGTDLADTGVELWSTDGTPANTKLFKDIDSAGFNSSYPLLLTSVVINDKLYFPATVEGKGRELWSTDGTLENTKLFVDINAGEESGDPVFLADIGVVSNAANNTDYTLQKIFYSTFKGKVYFTADDGVHGLELWSTDGTVANTKMVKDPNADDVGLGVSAGSPAVYTSNGIYFSGYSAASGSEPWITDGTAAGTKQIADINTADAGSSAPLYIFIYNNQIFFSADNGDSNSLTDLYKINQQIILPVNLVRFSASLQQQSVLLNWATAAEINTSHFIVERSADGVHFSEVNRVAALGNSSATHNYQFNDNNALRAGFSVLYYRLKTVDKDGNYTYSGISSVQVQKGLFTIKLSPNPVHNQLTATFATGNANRTVLRIVDANGRQLYQQVYAASQSSIQQSINMAKFAGGVYFVQLITDKEKKTLRLIKE